MATNAALHSMKFTGHRKAAYCLDLTVYFKANFVGFKKQTISSLFESFECNGTVSAVEQSSQYLNSYMELYRALVKRVFT